MILSLSTFDHLNCTVTPTLVRVLDILVAAGGSGLSLAVSWREDRGSTRDFCVQRFVFEEPKEAAGVDYSYMNETELVM